MNGQVVNQVVDIDGNVYNTAPMGFQKLRGSSSGPASKMKNTPWVGENIIWMTSNLNVSKFKNGEPIIEAKSDKEWEDALNKGIPAWCYLNNDSSNGKAFGKLYNYYAVTSLKGLAPEGWHIASETDWQYLYKKYSKYFNKNLTWEESRAINEDKVFMSILWKGPSGYGNNKTGFNALPSGMRFGRGFDSTGAYYWRGSAVFDKNHGAFKDIFGDPYLCEYGCEVTYQYGYSVRCVQDW